MTLNSNRFLWAKAALKEDEKILNNNQLKTENEKN